MDGESEQIQKGEVEFLNHTTAQARAIPDPVGWKLGPVLKRDRKRTRVLKNALFVTVFSAFRRHKLRRRSIKLHQFYSPA